MESHETPQPAPRPLRGRDGRPRGFTEDQRKAWAAQHLDGYIALLIEEREEEERNGDR